MGNAERIREAIDIVDLIGESIQLNKHGRGYKGLCPFHDEKTPSFYVDPERQSFHCFGCEEGGDAISFIEKYHAVDFRDAMDMLAARCGISLAHSADEQKKDLLCDINEQACRFFQSNLKNSPALDYLAKRKISQDSIEKFRLGYSLFSWDKLSMALLRDFNMEDIQQAGLVKMGEREQYDTFRGRLIFPIFSASGNKILGFGGRVLEKDVEPKYLNTPETPIFKKGKVLYGFNFASKAARKNKQLILVEGYTDVVHAHQAGIENVAAVIGTALTQEHLEFLGKRKDLELVLCYDADKGGVNAAVRSAEKVIARPRSRVWILPEGKDPANLAEEGKDFRKEIVTNIPTFEFLVRHYSQGQDMSTLSGKLAVLEGIKPAFQTIPSSRRGICIETLGQQIGITPESIANVLYESQSSQAYQSYMRGRRRKNRTSLEIEFMQLLVSGFTTGLLEHFVNQGIKEEDFRHPATRALFNYLTKQTEAEPLFYSLMPLALNGLEGLVENIAETAEKAGIIAGKDMLRNILLEVPRKKPSMTDLEFAYLRMRTRGFANKIPPALKRGKSLKDLIQLINESEQKLNS